MRSLAGVAGAQMRIPIAACGANKKAILFEDGLLNLMPAIT
jgi:hypothetical protein